MNSTLVRLSVVVTGFLFFAGCEVDVGRRAAKQLTDAIAAINEFNQVLDRTPENLRVAANKVIEKLHVEGEAFLAYDARQFADHTLGTAGVVAKGVVEYADAKMRAYLDALKSAIETALPNVKATKSKDKLVELLKNIKVNVKILDPFVEMVNPLTLDYVLQKSADSTVRPDGINYKSGRRLELTGYGLLRPEIEPQQYRLEVIKTDGESRLTISPTVSPAGPFIASVDLTDYFPMEGDKELRIFWGDKKLAHVAVGITVQTETSLPIEPPHIPAAIEGVLFDDGDTIRFKIEPGEDPNATVIVLNRTDNVSGFWKACVVANENGDISKIVIKDDDRRKEMTLTDGNLQGSLKVVFGKHGVLGVWRGITERPITKQELLGKRITYTWTKD